jgi:hypothetical protein
MYLKKSLYKKIIYFILFFVCISILLYVIITKVITKKEYLQVNATPISNKVVVIDAGHGLPDERRKFI